MPQKYGLSLINNETGETTSISGEFSDKEVKLLEAFIREADKLWETDFIQTGEKGQLNIQWDRETGAKISMVLPEWNQVIVFFTSFDLFCFRRRKQISTKFITCLQKGSTTRILGIRSVSNMNYIVEKSAKKDFIFAAMRFF